VGGRYALRSYDPGPASLLRFLAASCGFAAAALVLRRGLRWPPRSDLGRLVLSGCVGNTVYHVTLNTGQKTVTAAVASVLVATSPVFTALLARAFLGERLGVRGWSGIGIAFAGTLLIASRHGAPLGVEPGAAWILVAAVAQAVAFILLKPPLARASAFAVTAFTVWVGAATLALLFAADLVHAVRAAPASATLTLVYLGLCPGFAGALCFAYVLARLPASRAAPLLYAVPPLTLALGWALLGETITTAGVIGAIVTLAGVALVAAGRGR
jgi:drug/metabolite transporter (DMT)-like permease